MAPVPGGTCGLWAVGCGLGWGSAELTASHLGLTLALLFLTGTQAGTYGQHNLWAERMRRCMIGGLECISEGVGRTSTGHSASGSGGRLQDIQ